MSPKYKGGAKPKPRARRSNTTFEDDGEPRRCRAKSRKQDPSDPDKPVRCRQPKEPGYEVCRYHGGRSSGAPMKHGRFSARMGRFRGMFEAALDSNEDLLDLRNTLAIFDVAVQNAAERLEAKDTPDFRDRAWRLYQSARAAETVEEQGALLAQLGEHLRDGIAEDEAFANLVDMAERLAVRQEKAWGIKLSASQALNAQDMVVLMGRFIDIVLAEAPGSASQIVNRIDHEILGSGEIAASLPDHGQS